MEIELDIRKDVNENAQFYFSKAKKAKGKLNKIKEVIQTFEDNVNNLKIKEEKTTQFKEKKEEEIKKGKNRKIHWYEKFHWFISSEGYLIVAGRDATTNEEIIKKHTQKDDIVFHSSMPGSPFAVIKNKNNSKTQIPEKTIYETAQFCASFSRAWKNGLSYADVFWVTPEQISKEAKAGEYIAKGAFMVYGKRNIISSSLELSIGILNPENVKTKNLILSKDELQKIPMIAPKDAIKANCDDKEPITITIGTDKKTDIAKSITKKLNYPLSDDIAKILPTGGIRLRK